MSMTLEELLALLPDNTVGAIGADDVRTVTTELYNLPSGADFGDLHNALLATKVWSSTQYVWPGDGTAPDADSYTNIVFIDPTGTHDPATSTGGRNVANDIWETGTTPAGIPSGGTSGQVLVKDTSTDYDTSWATPSSAGIGLLAYKRHNPGTKSTVSTTSTTFADIDATNLTVTFTVPASGRVVVNLSAGAHVYFGTELGWGLRSGGSDVANSKCSVFYNGSGVAADYCPRLSYRALIDGLTAAASVTFTWSQARIFGSNTAWTEWGGSSGQALMEIWSA